jgi:RND family efflux transporter MFP subunit
MKKSWILLLLIIAAVAGGFYKLSSNKASIAKELQDRKRVDVTVPVTVVKAAQSPVGRSFKVTGTVKAQDQVTVLSQTNGQVQAVYRDVGDLVNVGTTLAVVDAKVTKTQLAMAKTTLSNAERNLARFEDLLTSGAAPQQTVDDLRLAVESASANVVALEKQVSNATVKSPVRGTVTARIIERGSVLGVGSPTFTVANLSVMILEAGLTEKEVANIKDGMDATVRIDAVSRQYRAKVSNIGVSADLSGRYRVEVRLDDIKKGELMSDLSGTVSFSLPTLDNFPVVPRKALVNGIKDPNVFVVKNGKVKLIPITISYVSGDEIVVEKGLEEGDNVVITGQLNLVDGTSVKVMN